jgi:hypothetical protein
MPDDAQIHPRETIEALRRELDARTAERDEVLAEFSLPLDGGGAGWGCRSRGARW